MTIGQMVRDCQPDGVTVDPDRWLRWRVAVSQMVGPPVRGRVKPFPGGDHIAVGTSKGDVLMWRWGKWLSASANVRGHPTEVQCMLPAGQGLAASPR